MGWITGVLLVLLLTVFFWGFLREKYTRLNKVFLVLLSALLAFVGFLKGDLILVAVWLVNTIFYIVSLVRDKPDDKVDE